MDVFIIGEREIRCHSIFEMVGVVSIEDKLRKNTN